jgi:hypothetical protein
MLSGQVRAVLLCCAVLCRAVFCCACADVCVTHVPSLCGAQEGSEMCREREAQAHELARVGTWVDSWIKFDDQASNFVPATRFVAMM